MRNGRAVLLVGYGNPLRADDRLGPYVVERVARLGLPGVETRTAQQLGIELVEDLVRFDLTVLVDAAQEGPPIEWRRVEAEGAPALSSASSHHLSPECLLALSERVYGRRPALYVCTILADSFAFGPALTPAARRRARRAIRRVAAFLRK